MKETVYALYLHGANACNDGSLGGTAVAIFIGSGNTATKRRINAIEQYEGSVYNNQYLRARPLSRLSRWKQSVAAEADRGRLAEKLTGTQQVPNG